MMYMKKENVKYDEELVVFFWEVWEGDLRNVDEGGGGIYRHTDRKKII